ncbi:class I SAM-dependent RNA methyltransferase [Marimonas lutisalis]|uniref:class I SAM-dependent RNA methyltransferase n=1 Tax=Marimonas lutisalis TaxID=2545756 RepID=UPI002E264DA8
MTATLSRNGLDIAVLGGAEPDGPLLLGLAQLAEAADLARLAWNGETMALRRPPVQVFGKAEVAPPPGAFLQATLEGEAALQATVSEIVSEASAIVDLFSGCGTFALPLAGTARVHAIEGDAEMIRALEKGWRNSTGLKRVTAETRDLYRNPLVGDEFNGFDACVIDPPRAGAEAQVANLAESGVGVIAFVSCNPTTFARDAAYMVRAGYTLDWVQVVDQFRWSSHVELVGKLTLTSA